MQPVPKVVVDRLRAVPPAVTHPDADVLTAFAEQSLPQRERATILDHLARCRDCREIVALALPEVAETQAVVRPVRGWSWPALRWGFVAAGVVLLSSIGFLRFHSSQRFSSAALTQSPKQEIAENQNTKAVASYVAPEASQPAAKLPPSAAGYLGSADAAKIANEKDKIAAGKKAESQLVASAKPQPPVGTIHGALSGGAQQVFGPRANQNQWQQNNSGVVNNQIAMALPPQSPAPHAVAPPAAAGARTADQKVPASSEMVEVQAQQRAEAVTVTADAPLQLKDSPVSGSAGVDDNDKVARAKAANVTVEVSGAAPALATESSDLAANGRDLKQLTLLSPPLLWHVNALGLLQRSVDKGHTWQTVNVTPAPTTANFSASAAEVVAEPATKSRAKASGSLKQAPAFLFLTVAAIGSEVWAGGSLGALYHSSDSGNNWTRVSVASSGVSLSGDVTSVEFSDVQHGKVSTSTQEVWATSDAGHTWQKQ